MHKYRTHKCDELRHDNVKDVVKLSGWVHRKRDHGQLIFIDLRDHYGLTQVVVDSSNDDFSIIENKVLIDSSSRLLFFNDFIILFLKTVADCFNP